MKNRSSGGEDKKTIERDNWFTRGVFDLLFNQPPFCPSFFLIFFFPEKKKKEREEGVSRGRERKKSNFIQGKGVQESLLLCARLWLKRKKK